MKEDRRNYLKTSGAAVAALTALADRRTVPRDLALCAAQGCEWRGNYRKGQGLVCPPSPNRAVGWRNGRTTGTDVRALDGPRGDIQWTDTQWVTPQHDAARVTALS